MIDTNATLRDALQAIIDRVKGVFDSPQLMEFGPLGDTDDDVERIASTALELARCDDIINESFASGQVSHAQVLQPVSRSPADLTGAATAMEG